MKIDQYAISLIASKAHAGQTRRGGGDYFEHPRRVAAKVRDKGEIYEAAAMLHDVVEDTAVTIDDLLHEGVPLEVVEIVGLLTKVRSVRYETYISRIRNSKIATAIKLADIADNLNDQPTTLQIRKYAMAMIILTGDAN
jgi:(p)ppGpp synthase/HD superfamily hydrolase